MLAEEAQWFGERIAAMDPASLYPMLDVGSSTAHFRQVAQPWIDEHLFRPAREAGHQVIHQDIKAAAGVDLVGDLADPGFLGTLSGSKFRSVFCANVLEHVVQREALCAALASLVPPGGHMLVAVPHRYPYHLDPVDTGFRPDQQELARLFPTMSVEEGATVAGGTFWNSITRTPGTFVKTIARIMVPFYNPPGWISVVHHLPWLFRRYQITCLILVKAA